MPEYLSPGVYVEEVDLGPKPIEGVGTAMPAFVGFTEKAEFSRQVNGEVVVENVLNRAQLITNWGQYRERFGNLVEGAYLPHAVYGYFHNGGGRCYIISVKTLGKASAGLLNADGKPQLTVRAAHGGYAGHNMRVLVDVVEQPAPKPAPKRGKSKAGEEEAPPPPEGGPDYFNITVEKQDRAGDWKRVEVVQEIRLAEVETEEGGQEVALAFKNNKPPQLIELVLPETSLPLAKLWPRTQQQSLSLEQKQLAAPSSQEFQGDVTERSGVEGLEALEDVTMVCVPDLMATPPGETLDLEMVKAVQTMIIGHCERMGDRVAILDTPPNLTPQEVKNWRMNTTGFDSSYAAMYYPWIQVDDPIQGKSILIPPSGHLAGVWARNDNTRGYWKAPANEIVQGATGLYYNATKGEQDTLNPNGVNCIRAFPGRGIRVWGARTLSSDPAWRYINVRRLFNYVEKSIENGTQWVVFEPNDHKLWARVRRDVSAFLRVVWQEGALFGLSPDEAFYVHCDEANNPPESRDLGRLIIEIGLCPVKPAEFVIFRISQWAGPNAL